MTGEQGIDEIWAFGNTECHGSFFSQILRSHGFQQILNSDSWEENEKKIIYLVKEFINYM